MTTSQNINNLLRFNLLRHKWGWFMALGVILLILGFGAAFYTFSATLIGVFYISLLMIIGGVVQIIHAFNVKTWNYFTLWLIAGIIYFIAGIICFYNPITTMVFLTFIFGLFFVLGGILRLIIGLQHKGVNGSSWIIIAGVLSILIGLVILLGWPSNSLYIIGLFVAVDLIFQGWGWVLFAYGLRSGRYAN